MDRECDHDHEQWNQDDDDGKVGSLTFTGDYTAVGSPSGMVFLI